MARKSGSAKKAARKAKERLAAEDLATAQQLEAAELSLDVEPSTSADQQQHFASAAPETLEISEQQTAASTDTDTDHRSEVARPLLQLLRRQSKGTLLCESIYESLRLLHEYQQYRYHKYRLEHTEVEIFRACKLWLGQALDCVPEYEKLPILELV